MLNLNRKQKIDLLVRVRAGGINLLTTLLEKEFPLPSWYWQQFDTREDLLKDLRKTRGEGVAVLWHKGRPYVLDTRRRTRPTWFLNEDET